MVRSGCFAMFFLCSGLKRGVKVVAKSRRIGSGVRYRLVMTARIQPSQLNYHRSPLARHFEGFAGLSPGEPCVDGNDGGVAVAQVWRRRWQVKRCPEPAEHRCRRRCRGWRRSVGHLPPDQLPGTFNKNAGVDILRDGECGPWCSEGARRDMRKLIAVDRTGCLDSAPRRGRPHPENRPRSDLPSPMQAPGAGAASRWRDGVSPRRLPPRPAEPPRRSGRSAVGHQGLRPVRPARAVRESGPPIAVGGRPVDDTGRHG